MHLSRRKFIQLNSVALSAVPFSGLFGCIHEYNSEEDLYNLFKNPPNSAKIFVRWWWNGNRVTVKEIIRELDVLKAAGVGGVEINPIAFPEFSDPKDIKPYDWLSDEWLDILKEAVFEAKKRNMTCDIIVGSGWPFGGRFLNLDEHTQLLAVGSRKLSGPQKITIEVNELIEETIPELTTETEERSSTLFDLRLTPSKMELLDSGLNLTSKVQDGSITINIPEGDHILYYLVKHVGFQSVIYGAPGADGPVLNHYNKDAVKKYLDNMSDALTKKLGFLGDHFRSMFCDSIELEGANWCDDMLVEFKKRNGYGLKPYLPFILFKTGKMGNQIGQGDKVNLSEELNNILQRVRYDFETTRIELIRERFINVFHNWCHEHGVKSRMQAYGRGFHPLEASMAFDIPECETWLYPHTGTGILERERGGWAGAYTMVNKFVSSAARLSGKKVVSCEELTNTRMVFNGTLERMKIAGDMSNLSGVTHSVIHGFSYNPSEIPFPGWVRYGTFLNERNPWWAYFHLWSKYKARLSAVLQNADLCSNVALLHPLADLWEKHGMQRDPFPHKKLPIYADNMWEVIQQNGSGCDHVSESVLQNSNIENKHLVYNNRRYQALILLEVESIQPETAVALNKFHEAGLLVLFIGEKPFKSPGLSDHHNRDAEVKNSIQKIIGSSPNCLIEAPPKEQRLLDWYSEVQKNFDIAPYVKFKNPVQFINQVHYRHGNDLYFFIANISLEYEHKLVAEFMDVEGKTPWIWNIEDGSRWIYPHKKESPQELEIYLEPAGSKLIVYSDKKEGEVYNEFTPGNYKTIPVNKQWHVRLNPVHGDSKKQQWDKLIDLNESEEHISFAGDIIYKTEIEVGTPEPNSYLDLGKVHGVSEVWINGNYTGIRWYGKHIYPCSDKLIPGKNTLEVKVVTVLGNYMNSLKDNEVAQYWMSRQRKKLYPMGMLGPVQVLSSI